MGVRKFKAARAIMVFLFWGLCIMLSGCRLFASPSKSGVSSRSFLHKLSAGPEIKIFERDTLLLAKSLEREGKYAEANRLYMSLIDAERSWQLILDYFIANNYFKMCDNQNAARSYRRVLLNSRREEFIDHETSILVDAALYKLSIVAVQDDYSLKVLKRLRRIIPVANFYLGITYQLRGDVFEASACYFEILNNGKNPYIGRTLREIVKDMRIVSELLNRGMSLESLIDLYLEFHLYKEAVIISYQGVENEKVLEQRAFCFFSLGDYSSAIGLYSDLSERSDNQMALLQLAYSCYYSGQYELAANYLQQHLDRIFKDDNLGAEKPPSPDAAFLILLF